jgi:hypothetical protein
MALDPNRVTLRGGSSGSMPRGLPLALLAAGLVACTQVPLASLWQLRKFDFENFDPAELRLALSLPSNVALWPEGLRVEVKVTREGASAPVEESFWFREQAGAAAGTELSAPASDRAPWVLLQLSARDSDRLRHWRQQLVATKSAQVQGKNKLELKIDPQACLRGGSLSPSASVSVALRWQAEPGFVMLLRDQALAEVGASLGVPAPSLQPCYAERRAPP